jgi:hypothetical protein
MRQSSLRRLLNNSWRSRSEGERAFGDFLGKSQPPNFLTAQYDSITNRNQARNSHIWEVSLAHSDERATSCALAFHLV